MTRMPNHSGSSLRIEVASRLRPVSTGTAGTVPALSSETPRDAASKERARVPAVPGKSA